jgi:hypothetical protein
VKSYPKIKIITGKTSGKIKKKPIKQKFKKLSLKLIE